MFVLAALTDRPDPAVPDALRDAVAALAGAWAVRTGRAFASDRVPAAGVDGTEPFAEPERGQLPAALAAAVEGHDGPVVLVGADVPRLDDELAAAALSDLASGGSLSFAPATDARPYLLALAGPAPELLAFAGAGEEDRATIAGRAAELGGEVGLLRSERRLVTPADARALAIDPLVPADLRALAASA